MFSLYPAFLIATYSTSMAIHKQTLPLRNWSAGDVGNPEGYVDRWNDDTPIPVEPMLLDLLAQMAACAPITTKWSQYTIYTMASPTAAPQPRYNASIDIDGTDATAGWTPGVQLQWNFRTTLFNSAKLVLLDAASDNDFNKISNPLDFPIYADVIDAYTALTNGWAGRDGGRPSVCFSVTKSINDRLHSAYEN